MAAIQMDSQADKKRNLDVVEKFVAEAARRGAQFVSMPENVHYIGTKEGTFENAEPIPGPMSEAFSSLARRYGVWLHCGSIGERIEGEERLYNTCLLFDPKGNLAGRYEKIHLFDVDIKNGPSTRESDTKKAGKSFQGVAPGFTGWPCFRFFGFPRTIVALMTERRSNGRFEGFRSSLPS